MKLNKRQLKQYGGNILDAFSGAATGVTGHGVNTIWVGPERTAATDIETRTIFLPWQGDDISKDKWLILRGYCMHEEQHLMHTDNTVWKTAVDDGGDIPTVVNILEDARINQLGRAQGKRGPVFDAALKHTWREIINTELIPAIKKGDVSKMPMKDQLFNAVLAVSAGLYALGLPKDTYAAKVTRAARMWWDKYKDQLFKGTTQTAYYLAQKLAEAGEKEEEEEKEQRQQQGDGQGECKGQGQGEGEGQGQGQGEGQGEGQGQGQGGGSGGAGGAGAGDGGGDLSKAWTDAVSSNADQSEWKEYEDSDKHVVTQIESLHCKTVQPQQYWEIRAAKFTEAQAEVRASCNRAGSLLRRALIEQKRSGMLRQQDEGILDPDVLADVALGRAVDGPFIRKARMQRDNNTIITVMGDASSSMDQAPGGIELGLDGDVTDRHSWRKLGKGNMFAISSNEARAKVDYDQRGWKKLSEAVAENGGVMSLRMLQSATLLGVHDMLRQVRITHELVVFTNTMTRYKSFDQKAISPNLIPTMLGEGNGGGTPTGNAMRTCADQLLRRPETRKIILCMTDGQSGSAWECAAMIRVLRELGIEVYGFGMMDNAISRVFPDPEESTVIAVDPLDLPDKLSQLIRRIALRQG